MAITTRFSTLRARLEEKRQQIVTCPRNKRGRVLFHTMRWLFYHAIPKNSSIYDAMVGGLLGALRRTLRDTGESSGSRATTGSLTPSSAVSLAREAGAERRAVALGLA